MQGSRVDCHIDGVRIKSDRQNAHAISPGITRDVRLPGREIGRVERKRNLRPAPQNDKIGIIGAAR